LGTCGLALSDFKSVERQRLGSSGNMSGVFPGMKPAEVLFETSIWRKRPHSSQRTREMGHPLVPTRNSFI
jgi:hypothetical protein